jgi:hypothetical protein
MDITWQRKQTPHSSYLEAEGPAWTSTWGEENRTWSRIMREWDIVEDRAVYAAFICDGHRYSATFQFDTQDEARDFATTRLNDLAERLRKDPVPHPFLDWEPGLQDPRLTAQGES